MRRKTYVGVSLLYVQPKHGVAQIDSFCVAASSSKQVKAKVKTIAADRVAREPATFLGIEDIFHVEGPLRSGGLFGSAMYGELKTLAAAKKLVTPFRVPASRHPWLCAVPIHFVQAADGNYTLASHMIVRRSSSPAEQIRRLASSPAFVAALKRSQPFEPLDDKYRLVGFRRIQILAGDPTTSAPFERLERRYRSLSKLRLTLVSSSHIDAFFAPRQV